MSNSALASFGMPSGLVMGYIYSSEDTNEFYQKMLSINSNITLTQCQSAYAEYWALYSAS